MTRRRWLAAAAGTALAGATLNGVWIEPRRVTVTRHRIGRPAAAGIGITQLTDLHLRSVASHEERIAHAVAELRPDVIVFTGDSIDHADHLDLLADFLKLLPLGVPKLAILGNWEHWGGVDLARLARVYGGANCQLLRNRSVTLELAGASLLVTGLDDLVGGAPDLHAALADVEPAANHLLLAHCPAQRETLGRTVAGSASRESTWPAIAPGLLTPQLMLSGHTHGGQIAPFGWAPLRPQGSGRYTRGWYRDRGIPMYVSRGLGTSVVPVRFGAPPEVAHFEWGMASR